MPTCDTEVRRFECDADNFGVDNPAFVVSTDFPMAQKRWRGNAGVDCVQNVSDVLNAATCAGRSSLWTAPVS